MDEGETAALLGEGEALCPAVAAFEGLGLEGLAVEGGVPARVGAVGDAQGAALLAGRDLGMGLDGSGVDGDGGLALLAGEDRDAGGQPLDLPDGGAVVLVALAQAGVPSRVRRIAGEPPGGIIT